MSDLRRDSLSFPEALGQSVANVSPTFTPALAISVVAGLAGTASWLVYLFATVALVIVGINVSKLAARIPSAGSFFIYVARSIGPSWGLLSGWAMLLAYIATAMSLTVATSIFLKTLLAALGIGVPLPNVLLYFLISTLIFVLAYRDMRMSSRLGLTLEAISMAAILAVCVVTWGHYGFAVDAKQTHLAGADLKNVGQACVFAIFSYVGFESASTLGQETRNPRTSIPRAVILTPIVAGLFFMFTTYVITLGFGDDAAKLGASGTPLSDITTHISVLATVLVYVGAAISAFACALASLNAFSRMLFSLGRYQFLHRTMGLVHSGRQTPYTALLVGAVLNFGVLAAFAGQAESDLVGYYGTVATFGFIFVYLLCSICAPILMRKMDTVSALDWFLGGLGALLMVVALVGSVYPVPDYPNNVWPYLFIAYMLVGLAWFFVLKARVPQTLLGIEHDLETVQIPHYGKIEI